MNGKVLGFWGSLIWLGGLFLRLHPGEWGWVMSVAVSLLGIVMLAVGMAIDCK